MWFFKKCSNFYVIRVYDADARQKHFKCVSPRKCVFVHQYACFLPNNLVVFTKRSIPWGIFHQGAAQDPAVRESRLNQGLYEEDASESRNWCDQRCKYFLKYTGIALQFVPQNRVTNFPPNFIPGPLTEVTSSEINKQCKVCSNTVKKLHLLVSADWLAATDIRS